MSHFSEYQKIDFIPEVFFYKSMKENEDYFLIDLNSLKLFSLLKIAGEISKIVNEEITDVTQKTKVFPNQYVVLSKSSPLGYFIINHKKWMDVSNYLDSQKCQNALIVATYYGAEDKRIAEISWLFKNNINGPKEAIINLYPELAETIAYILETEEFAKIQTPENKEQVCYLVYENGEAFLSSVLDLQMCKK